MAKINSIALLERVLSRCLENNSQKRLYLYYDQGKEIAQQEARKFLKELEEELFQLIDKAYEGEREVEWLLDPYTLFVFQADNIFCLAEDCMEEINFDET